MKLSFKWIARIVFGLAYVAFYFWLPTGGARIGLMIASLAAVGLWAVVMMGADVFYRLRHGKKA